MCLTNVKGGLRTAKKDIKVFKVLNIIGKLTKTPKHGSDFEGVINNIPVSGKISISPNGKVFFCHNEGRVQGIAAENKLGYKYSWVADPYINSIKVGGKELIDPEYITPFEGFPIKLGGSYDSPLEYSYELNSVDKGLHTFKKRADAEAEAEAIFINGVVVEATIPKGANYYEGKFDKVASFASNQLKY